MSELEWLDFLWLIKFVAYVALCCYMSWWLAKQNCKVIRDLYEKEFKQSLDAKNNMVKFMADLDKSYDTRVKLIDEALLKISELYTAVQPKPKANPPGNKRKRTAEEKRQASEKAKARWALKKLKQPQPLDRTVIDMTNMQT